MSDVLKFPQPKKNEYAEVATLRQRQSGMWELKPPGPIEPMKFGTREAAIKFCEKMGWGVHETPRR